MEYNLLVLFFFCPVLYVQGAGISPRLVNGAPVDSKNGTNLNIPNFSNLACLHSSSDSCCTGFLLSEKVILTTAQCIMKKPTFGYSPRIMSITTYSLPTNDSDSVIIHPDYNPETKQNDIGILLLDQSVPGLSAIDIANAVPKESTNCTVSGYGTTSPGQKPEGIPYMTEVHITTCEGNQQEGHICAAEENLQGVLCKGDIGAPLICDNELVGIAVSDSSCGSGGPDVYQDLQKIRQWIKDYIPNSAASLVLNHLAFFSTLLIVIKIAS